MQGDNAQLGGRLLDKGQHLAADALASRLFSDKELVYEGITVSKFD